MGKKRKISPDLVMYFVVRATRDKNEFVISISSPTVIAEKRKTI